MKYLMMWIVLVSQIALGAQNCRSIEDEPVSRCRAEKACGKGRVGPSIGLVLGGMGAGMARGFHRNHAQDNYDACVDRDLSAQKASAGIEDSSLRCKTIQVAEDEFKTECH